jgi:hypothetical protein
VEVASAVRGEHALAMERAEMDTVVTESPVVAPLVCPVPPRRRGLRTSERVELVLGALGLLAVAAATGGLEWSVSLGTLVCYAAIVILGQGLVRDLVRLLLRSGPPAKRERLVCLCAESTIGMGLVAAGAALLLVGSTAPLVVDRGELVAGLGSLFTFGFFAKDWVLVLRRVEDHASISPF